MAPARTSAIFLTRVIVTFIIALQLSQGKVSGLQSRQELIGNDYAAEELLKNFDSPTGRCGLFPIIARNSAFEE
jgi:hypothetical protein